MSTTDQAVSARPEVLEAIIALQREIAESGLGLDPVMRLAAVRAQELTEADGALVEMVDGDRVTCRVATGVVNAQLGQSVPFDGSLSGQALRTGRMLRSEDTEHDPRVDPEACRSLGARSLAVAPVRAVGHAGAALKVVSERIAAFDPADGRAVELLAGVISAGPARATGHQVRSRQDVQDPLTGLANRALFLDRLGAALSRLGRRRSTVALLSVGLDGFHDVNDSLGRQTGDRLLVAAAGRIREIVRGTDTVARLGGDDFALVCEDAGGPKGAGWVAERILEWLGRPFRVEGNEIRVGATIGIAVAEGPDVDPEDLLRRAGQAMYAAKADGGGRYRFGDAPNA